MSDKKSKRGKSPKLKKKSEPSHPVKANVKTTSTPVSSPHTTRHAVISKSGQISRSAKNTPAAKKSSAVESTPVSSRASASRRSRSSPAPSNSSSRSSSVSRSSPPTSHMSTPKGLPAPTRSRSNSAARNSPSYTSLSAAKDFALTRNVVVRLSQANVNLASNYSTLSKKFLTTGEGYDSDVGASTKADIRRPSRKILVPKKFTDTDQTYDSDESAKAHIKKTSRKIVVPKKFADTVPTYDSDESAKIDIRKPSRKIVAPKKFADTVSTYDSDESAKVDNKKTSKIIVGPKKVAVTVSIFDSDEGTKVENKETSGKTIAPKKLDVTEQTYDSFISANITIKKSNRKNETPNKISSVSGQASDSDVSAKADIKNKSRKRKRDVFEEADMTLSTDDEKAAIVERPRSKRAIKVPKRFIEEESEDEEKPPRKKRKAPAKVDVVTESEGDDNLLKNNAQEEALKDEENLEKKLTEEKLTDEKLTDEKLTPKVSKKPKKTTKKKKTDSPVKRERKFHCRRCGEMFLDINVLASHPCATAGEDDTTIAIPRKKAPRSTDETSNSPSMVRDFVSKMKMVLGNNTEQNKVQLKSPVHHISDTEKLILDEIEGNVRCRWCVKTFMSASRLRSHYRRDHANLYLHCSECGEMCRGAITFHKHTKTHAIDRLTCKICSLQSANRAAARIHSQSHKEKKLCPVCGKCFDKLAHYHHHQKIHTEIKPYKCDKCGKSYRHKTDLVRHKFLHSGVRPYSCHLCNSKFRRPSTLKTHIRMHTGERPYQCSHCSLSFKTSSDMRRHEARHGDKKPHCCTVCDWKFSLIGELRRHIQTMHNPEKPKKSRPYNGGYKCRMVKIKADEEIENGPSVLADIIKNEAKETESEISDVTSNKQQTFIMHVDHKTKKVHLELIPPEYEDKSPAQIKKCQGKGNHKKKHMFAVPSVQQKGYTAIYFPKGCVPDVSSDINVGIRHGTQSQHKLNIGMLPQPVGSTDMTSDTQLMGSQDINISVCAQPKQITDIQTEPSLQSINIKTELQEPLEMKAGARSNTKPARETKAVMRAQPKQPRKIKIGVCTTPNAPGDVKIGVLSKEPQPAIPAGNNKVEPIEPPEINIGGVRYSSVKLTPTIKKTTTSDTSPKLAPQTKTFQSSFIEHMNPVSSVPVVAVSKTELINRVKMEAGLNSKVNHSDNVLQPQPQAVLSIVKTEQVRMQTPISDGNTGLQVDNFSVQEANTSEFSEVDRDSIVKSDSDSPGIAEIIQQLQTESEESQDEEHSAMEIDGVHVQNTTMEIAEVTGQNTTMEIAEVPVQNTTMEISEVPGQNMTMEIVGVPVHDTTLEIANVPIQSTEPHMEIADAAGQNTAMELADVPIQNTEPRMEIANVPIDNTEPQTFSSVDDTESDSSSLHKEEESDGMSIHEIAAEALSSLQTLKTASPVPYKAPITETVTENVMFDDEDVSTTDTETMSIHEAAAQALSSLYSMTTDNGFQHESLDSENSSQNEDLSDTSAANRHPTEKPNEKAEMDTNMESAPAESATDTIKPAVTVNDPQNAVVTTELQIKRNEQSDSDYDSATPLGSAGELLQKESIVSQADDTYVTLMNEALVEQQESPTIQEVAQQAISDLTQQIASEITEQTIEPEPATTVSEQSLEGEQNTAVTDPTGVHHDNAEIISQQIVDLNPETSLVTSEPSCVVAPESTPVVCLADDEVPVGEGQQPDSSSVVYQQTVDALVDVAHQGIVIEQSPVTREQTIEVEKTMDAMTLIQSEAESWAEAATDNGTPDSGALVAAGVVEQEAGLVATAGDAVQDPASLAVAEDVVQDPASLAVAEDVVQDPASLAVAEDVVEDTGLVHLAGDLVQDTGLVPEAGDMVQDSGSVAVAADIVQDPGLVQGAGDMVQNFDFIPGAVDVVQDAALVSEAGDMVHDPATVGGELVSVPSTVGGELVHDPGTVDGELVHDPVPGVSDVAQDPGSVAGLGDTAPPPGGCQVVIDSGDGEQVIYLTPEQMELLGQQQEGQGLVITHGGKEILLVNGATQE